MIAGLNFDTHCRLHGIMEGLIVFKPFPISNSHKKCVHALWDEIRVLRSKFKRADIRQASYYFRSEDLEQTSCSPWTLLNDPHGVFDFWSNLLEDKQCGWRGFISCHSHRLSHLAHARDVFYGTFKPTVLHLMSHTFLAHRGHYCKEMPCYDLPKRVSIPPCSGVRLVGLLWSFLFDSSLAIYKIQFRCKTREATKIAGLLSDFKTQSARGYAWEALSPFNTTLMFRVAIILLERRTTYWFSSYPSSEVQKDM